MYTRYYALTALCRSELLLVNYDSLAPIYAPLTPPAICIVFLRVQLSVLICRQLQAEPMEDDQASVISYFVQTAKVYCQHTYSVGYLHYEPC